MTDPTIATAAGNAPVDDTEGTRENHPSQPAAVAAFAKPQSLDMFDRGNLLRALNNLADQVHDIGIRSVTVDIFHVDRASLPRSRSAGLFLRRRPALQDREESYRDDRRTASPGDGEGAAPAESSAKGCGEVTGALDVQYGERVSLHAIGRDAELRIYSDPDADGFHSTTLTHLNVLQLKSLAALCLICAEEIERRTS
jgi:hypothetical protein